VTFGRNNYSKYAGIEFVCFSFHVGLIVIALSSLRLHNLCSLRDDNAITSKHDETACMFLLYIVDISEKSHF